MSGNESSSDLRRSGIGDLRDVPWGTHIGHFYRTKADLLAVLVPYFREGLAANEACIWLTSEPLEEKEAAEALRGTIPDVDRLARLGQIKIMDFRRVHAKEETHNPQLILAKWADLLRDALAGGFTGLRAAANTSTIGKDEWTAFTRYEHMVDGIIGYRRLLALCSYALEQCGPAEIADVLANHEYTLVRRRGDWRALPAAEAAAVL